VSYCKPLPPGKNPFEVNKYYSTEEYRTVQSQEPREWEYKRLDWRDIIGEFSRILQSRQSKVIEEEMTRRLHSDLK
jgi:hypothetical protein